MAAREGVSDPAAHPGPPPRVRPRVAHALVSTFGVIRAPEPVRPDNEVAIAVAVGDLASGHHVAILRADRRRRSRFSAALRPRARTRLARAQVAWPRESRPIARDLDGTDARRVSWQLRDGRTRGLRLHSFFRARSRHRPRGPSSWRSMKTPGRTSLLLTMLLAWTPPAPACAQELPVRSGETVRVRTISTGEVLRGVVLVNQDGVISLRVNGRRVEVPVDDVRRLDLEVHDSLVNGTLIGAAVLGVMCVLTCGQGLDSSDDVGQAVLTNAMLGGAIGALVDWRNNEHRVVYERPRDVRQSRARVTFPLITLRF